jgi:hypothetical protein
MRTPARLAWSLVVASFLAGSSVHAQPHAWLNWDACSTPFSNLTKFFSGPTVVHEVVSASGFSGTVTGYVLKLVVQSDNLYNFPSNPLPDAWRFDGAGCQTGHLSITPDGAGCGALAPTGATTFMSAGLVGQQLLITYSVTFPPYTPAATNFVLADLAFDHAQSAAGTPPSGCGGAERQACFTIQSASWLDVYLTAHPISFETFSGLEWQPSPGLGCLGDLPVHNSSWGTLKTLYR